MFELYQLTSITGALQYIAMLAAGLDLWHAGDRVSERDTFHSLLVAISKIKLKF